MSNEVAVTWVSGASISAETIDCSGMDKAIGIYLILGFGDTELSGRMIMQNGNTAQILKVDGTEWVLTVDPLLNQYFPLDPAVFAGINKFQLRRGTQGTPNTDANAETLVKVLRREY